MLVCAILRGEADPTFKWAPCKFKTAWAIILPICEVIYPILLFIFTLLTMRLRKEYNEYWILLTLTIFTLIYIVNVFLTSHESTGTCNGFLFSKIVHVRRI